MISGIRSFVIVALLIPVAALAQIPADGLKDADALPIVMQDLASVRHATGHFVEEKYMQALTVPLESQGTLSYNAPDRIEKITTGPEAERLSVNGNQIVIERDGETHTLDLADHPEIAAFVESVRATLAGNLPALMQLYTVGFKGTVSQWEMVLQPTDSTVQQMVTSITIKGNDDRLTSIETLLAGGDRSEMTITADHP